MMNFVSEPFLPRSAVLRAQYENCVDDDARPGGSVSEFAFKLMSFVLTIMNFALITMNLGRWDVYREQIRLSDAGVPEVLFQGNWEAMIKAEETFNVRGGEAVHEVVWSSARHGPVLVGDPLTDNEVCCARWGLMEPAHDMDAILAMHRAANVSEATEAARLFDSVSGNFCIADLAGDVVYQYSGRLPKRPPMPVPMPGWTGEHEWTGDVPKDELPHELNPAAGFVFSANNRTTTEDYPHYLTTGHTRFRADRLHELFHAHEGSFTRDDARAFQADETSVAAREFAQAVCELVAADAAAATAGAEVLEMLRGWDGLLGEHDSTPLAYHELANSMIKLTVRPFYSPKTGNFWGEEMRILHDQLMQGNDLMLGEFGDWAAVVLAALPDAVEMLHSKHGADASAWEWGVVHRVAWRHSLGRDDADLFNLTGTSTVPHLPLGGDGNTTCCLVGDYKAAGTHGVSYRQLFDLSDLNAAEIVIPPGNSGRVGSPHAADNLERWKSVDYHPLFVEWSDIEVHKHAETALTPQGWEEGAKL